MHSRLTPRVRRETVVFCFAAWTAVVVNAAGLGGVFSPDQVEHGAKIFQEKCASCHGSQLEGGDHGPPLKDDGFWQEWSGKTARSLYSRIISTMPPDDAGSLAEKDVIHILAHFAAVNGAAPGAKPLERADELNNIPLERPK
jgi:cytochrome c